MNFSNLLSNFNLIAFGRVWNFTHFGVPLQVNLLCKSLLNPKEILTYDVITNAYSFFIFEKKSYFFPHIAECADTAEIFCQKNFRRYCPPLYQIFSRSKIHVEKSYFLKLIRTSLFDQSLAKNWSTKWLISVVPHLLTKFKIIKPIFTNPWNFQFFLEFTKFSYFMIFYSENMSCHL